MRSNLITSALTIVLAFTSSIVSAVGEPIATTIVAGKIRLSPQEVLPAVQPDNTQDIPINRTDRSLDAPLSPQEVLPAVQPKKFPKNPCPSDSPNADVAVSLPLELSIAIPKSPLDIQEEKAGSLLCEERKQYRLGQYEEALKNGQESLRIYRAIKHYQGEGNVLNDLGLTYHALRRHSQAIESYEQALLSLRKINDRRQEGITLENLGFVYSDLGDNSKAANLRQQYLLNLDEINSNQKYERKESEERYLKVNEQNLLDSRNKNDLKGQIASLNNLAFSYRYFQRYDKELESYEEALSISRRSQDSKNESSVLSSLGLYYYRSGDYTKAIEFYEKSLKIVRLIQDKNSEELVLESLGSSYLSTGQYTKAIEYYEQIPSTAWNHSVRENLGRSYFANGNYAKAIEHHEKALAVARKFEDRIAEGTSLSSLGATYITLGSDLKAIEYYEKSLTIAREIKDRSWQITELINIGTIYFNLESDTKAIEYYEKSLVFAREIRDRVREGISLGNLGNVYGRQGQYAKAITYHKKSLAIARNIKYRRGEGIALGNLGVSYTSLGQHDEAVEYQTQSLSLARELKDLEREHTALSNLGLALAKKEPELAIVFYKKSVNVAESIRQNNRSLSRDLQSSYTETVAVSYHRLANLLIKQGRLPEAQAVLELLKLKEIIIYTRDTQRPSNGISFTSDEQKALDKFLATYGTAAAFAQELSRCADAQCPKLKQLLSQRDRNNKIIREMLDRLRTTLKDQVIDLSKLNTEEFNNAAKAIVNAQPGTVLIYPIITETKIQFLLAFKAGTGNNAAVTFRAIDGETINSETIFKTAQTFRESLQSANSDLPKLKATSQQLYRWLIKPLEPEINQSHIKHLVFATDRVTRNLPISALHDGQNYLITKPYSLSTITSATGTTPNALPPTSPKVLAVGASQFTGASALPYVEAETNAIVQTTQTPKGIFPGDRFLNQQFTFDTLKSNLSNHNILHIATHGFLDAGNIDNSHLLTSNGDKIDKSKIQLLNDYGLNNIHLVILSACNTATGGKNIDGLEIAGISHYFMKNGTKSVIASLWQVNDPATALFMQQFYQHIQSGKTKAQALQQVQQAFITDRLTLKDAEAIDRAGVRLHIPGQLPHNSLAHPYYWAPFILIGNNL